MSELNTNEELDPTEEVGPEQSEVPPQETEVILSEGGIQHQQVDFLQELGEAYEPQEIHLATHPEDGLPYAPDTGELSLAPPFTYDNVVCVEDDRVYVEFFADEPEFRFIHDNNCRFTTDSHDNSNRFTADGDENTRREFDSSVVKIKFGVFVAELDGKKFHVRPKRPKCIHYKRQMFLNDDQPDENEPGHKIIFRNCAIRTSVGGASMSLRDQAVLACDWRSPPDLESTKRHLDTFDEDKLSSKKHLKMIPLFGNRE